MRLLVNEENILNEDMIGIMKEAAGLCVSGEGLDPSSVEISLSFVSEEEIRELNRDYRGIDRVTDVLSFPLLEDLGELTEMEEDEEAEDIALGDVVICLAKAESQAEEFGHSREREIVYLFVHSVLHLLGYDHLEEEDQRQMRRREEEVMDAVRLPREEN